MGWRRIVSGIGRTCIASGVLILLFVAYQLWGTGLSEARAQDRLRSDFLDALERTPTTNRSSSTSSTSVQPSATETTAPPTTLPRNPTGEAVAIIRIPKIGVEKAVVEGTGVSALKKGPGHYPTTPMPGQPGNAAIAGHRTTYGAPFFRLDELQKGDRIEVTTTQGEFVYRVVGTEIVKPSENRVLGPTQDNRLTLTTCNPRYSAQQRMIVTAALTDEPVEPPPVVVEPDAGGPDASGGIDTGTDDNPVVETPSLADDASVSGESTSKWPAILWGGLAAVIWLVTWLLSKRWGRVPAYAMGVPVFLVVLFIFFENFARLLPANV